MYRDRRRISVEKKKVSSFLVPFEGLNIAGNVGILPSLRREFAVFLGTRREY